MEFVVYSSDDEVIVCVLETEHQVIDEYFNRGGRNIEEYDRTTRKTTGVNIRPLVRVSY
jgi:hypothetical protein